MKLLKKIIIGCICMFPMLVNAGSIALNNPIRLSNEKYSFTLTVKDIDLNYMSGKINISNGYITKITMANGWVNKTGTNNQFYFYKDGISTGNYLIATFEVTMIGNSEYSLSDFQYGANKCQKDSYGNFIGKNGNVVNEATYQNECGKSKDATLKRLIPSIGTLSPTFSANTNFYTLKVPQDTNIVTFQAKTNHEKAGIISGTFCALVDTITDCEIRVKAESGDINSYIIRVDKGSNSGEKIQNFKVHNGVLNTTFHESKTSYMLTPDKNAEVIYFSFRLNGVDYTSNKCSANASSCSLTITINETKQTYLFTIASNEQEEKIESTKKETATSTTEQTKTSKKTETTTKTNTKSTTTNTEEKKTEEEPTINPVEYNKKKKEEQKEIETISEKEIENKPKQEQENQSKHTFLIILSLINILIGICIGLFMRRKHKNEI